ncbi:MAG: RluA family pseudouridine synthase [Bacteroidales bacterium]|nr:RluA family pseudouridine synthase [Bacteroidales bacterium]
MRRNNNRHRNTGSAPAEIKFISDKDSPLLELLLEKINDRSKTKVREMLKSGRVVAGGIATSAFDFPVKRGMEIRILPKPKLMREGGINNSQLDILYEDYDVIVINKKEGLLSVGTDGDKENTAYHIVNMHVKKGGRNHHIYVVHRLDRKTSGVMMFAKSMAARDTLRNNWSEMVMERSYYAVVEGVPQYKKDSIKSYLTEDKMLKIHSSFINNGGQMAVTNYEVLQSNDEYSLVKCNLDTGRKNQIRVQMSAIGHPVAGDAKYDAQTNPLKRVCLHAATLQFKHPKTGKVMKFEVPVPNGFFKVVRKQESAPKADEAK